MFGPIGYWTLYPRDVAQLTKSYVEAEAKEMDQLSCTHLRNVCTVKFFIIVDLSSYICYLRIGQLNTVNSVLTSFTYFYNKHELLLFCCTLWRFPSDKSVKGDSTSAFIDFEEGMRKI